MDNLKIDSHKLNFHPKRVSDWIESNQDWEKVKKVYPIYMEISPSGICNNRCSFCALDFAGYKPIFLEKEVLVKRIGEMALMGVKSIMFAGEGEPLLHKNMAEIAVYAKRCGIDVAFTTNGTCLTEKFCNEALNSIQWIKVSINAGTAKTHAKIHGTSKDHFGLVLRNIEKAIKVRERNKYQCVIGSQMLLLPENREEVIILAEVMKNIGCDYLVIKPYSQHPQSKTRCYENLDYSGDNFAQLEKDLNDFCDERFKVVFRRHTMEKFGEKRPYNRCHSTPFFWAYMTAEGLIYSCSMFLGNEDFLIGNINTETFQEIWEGEKRRKNWEFLRNMDSSSCRIGCRMDECNRYLDLLLNPPKHVNFI